MADVTIGNFIDNQRKRSTKMSDYFFKGVLVDDSTKLKVLDDSMLIGYEGHLAKYRKEWDFSDDEYRLYKYNPWKVSLDIYGTTELWFLVLHSNELYSADEFNMRHVAMYTSDVVELLAEIIALNDRDIRKNNTEVNNQIRTDKSNLTIQVT